jgi:signal transduction histidine kinase
MRKSSEKIDRSQGNTSDNLRFGLIAQKFIKEMPFGVIIFDENLNSTDSNSFADNILESFSSIHLALSEGTDSKLYPSWENMLQEALKSDNPTTFDNIPYSHSQRNLLLRLICIPLQEERTNKLLGGILLIEDITAKTAMESDLASAERLAAVGKLAASVAHELNNPLDGIMRYINLALRVAEAEQQDKLADYLRESRKGLQRMVQIISELLEFSRSAYSSFQEADINKIVEEAVKTLEAQLQENQITILRNYAANMPNIRSGNLFQVFCNLIKNAIDAMDQGGTLEVTTRCDSHNLFIEFADTGTGLSKNIRAKLFEPFFTTKAPGKGTGLGLAISRDIVERYNGQLLADNRPTGGSIFTVSIPLERTSRGT